MPLFKYKVADENGTIKEVLIDAENQSDSLQRLRQRGFVPLEFLGEKIPEKHSGLGVVSLKGRFDVCEFTNLLAPLLSAHVPIEKALGIIAQISPNEDFAQTVSRMRKNLHEGKKFSAIIRDNGAIFPRMYASLVEAGEETGSLTEVISELRKYLNESRETRNFLITSSIYPAFVFSIIFALVVLLFTVFIPRFARIFAEMNKPMPLLTHVVFMFSKILANFWYIWLSLLIVLAIGLIILQKRGILRKIWDEYSIKIPLIGNLIIMAEMGKFLRTLSVLVSNHVNVLNSVTIAVSVLSNEVIRKTFSLVTTELKGGKKLSTALSRSPFMPKVALQMLSVGEESGQMGEMLIQVANTVEGELKHKVKRLLALFEPIVILFLAGIIIIVVLAIILAILEIQNV